MQIFEEVFSILTKSRKKQQEDAAEHEVVLKRKEDSTGDDFGILGFLVSFP